MVPDGIINRVPKSLLLHLLRKELLCARDRKPFPHFMYRSGLSFMDQMTYRDITPSEIGSTSAELSEFEQVGAALAVRETLNVILNGDPLLEQIPVLVSFIQQAMNRYRFSLDLFCVQPAQIEKRIRVYWLKRGRHFVRLLRKTQGVHESTQTRIWYLHEIRTAMNAGAFTKANIFFNPQFYQFVVHRIACELDTMRIALEKIDLLSRTRATEIQRYNSLVLLSQTDRNDFPM